MNRQTNSFTENILMLVNLLRQAGMPVSTEQVIDFTQALTVVTIGERDQVYYAARGILVNRYEHLQLFETIFNLFWQAHASGRVPKHQPASYAPRHQPEHKAALITYMAQRALPNDPEVDIADKSATFSDLEILQGKDFSQMTPEELQAVKRLIETMRWQGWLRRTRRRVASGNGDMLHMRRVMAAAVKHGGVPLVLAWQTRKFKQRPIILIADISGSMDKYSRLVLQFFYSVMHSLKQVECFVFGTRLTRITLSLKLKNIDRAVDEASRVVVDWSGGTRIGESLETFNRQWSRRVLWRGAIVVMVSDGWERGDVANFRRQMRYLQLRCYRLIWLNPLLGRTHYQPLVEGMAAALPYIDDFLPIHNLYSLSALAHQLQLLHRQR